MPMDTPPHNSLTTQGLRNAHAAAVLYREEAVKRLAEVTNRVEKADRQSVSPRFVGMSRDRVTAVAHVAIAHARASRAIAVASTALCAAELVVAPTAFGAALSLVAGAAALGAGAISFHSKAKAETATRELNDRVARRFVKDQDLRLEVDRGLELEEASQQLAAIIKELPPVENFDYDAIHEIFLANPAPENVHTRNRGEGGIGL